jgi:hypothetical protein
MRIKMNNGRVKMKGGRVKYNYYNESRDVIKTIQTEVSLNYYERLNAHFSVGIQINEGIWLLNLAHYGLLGRTASTHKWNWRNLLNTDSAFRILYEGTQTHNVYGVVNSATSSSMITNVTTARGLNYDNFHFSYYANGYNIGGTTLGDDMGIVQIRGYEGYFLSSQSSKRFITLPNGNITFNYESLGFFIGNRNKIALKNFLVTSFETIQGSITTSPVTTDSNFVIRFGGRTSDTGVLDTASGVLKNYTRFGCVAIGSSLTESQSLIKRAITNFSQNMRQYF